MGQGTVLAVLALVAAVWLLLKKEARLWAIVATVAAGLLVLSAFGWLNVSLRGIDLGLVLGGALVVAGGFLFGAVKEKLRVAAATAIALTGALLVASALGLL